MQVKFLSLLFFSMRSHFANYSTEVSKHFRSVCRRGIILFRVNKERSQELPKQCELSRETGNGKVNFQEKVNAVGKLSQAGR